MEVLNLLFVMKYSHMKKNDLLTILKDSKIRDYTYAIIFFIVSTFFAFFVIRPVLTIALSIRREAKDLTAINKDYETNIQKVLSLQYEIEQLRPRRGLIDEAMPSQPMIPQVITDIQNASAQSGVPIKLLSIQAVSLMKNPEAKIETARPTVKAIFKTVDSFAHIQQFLEAIAHQRRVKGLKNINMTVEKLGEEKVVSLEIEIESYYSYADDSQ